MDNEAFGLKTNEFDYSAYIESGFLDKRPGVAESEPRSNDLELTLPLISEYLNVGSSATKVRVEEPDVRKAKFKKTVMSAPRPRRAKKEAPKTDIDPDLQTVWTALPNNVAFLCSFFDDTVTKNYYRGEFKESRQELISRLLDPELSLEEAARLLGVCPATVRRYTNRGWLSHHRTVGGQRRFRLSNIVRFVDEHGRKPQE